MLCVQDEVNREMVQINRINKPADLMTKHVSGERIKILFTYLDMTKVTPAGSSATVLAANDEHHPCPRRVGEMNVQLLGGHGRLKCETLSFPCVMSLRRMAK